jgi:hypothetical protein
VTEILLLLIIVKIGLSRKTAKTSILFIHEQLIRHLHE